MSAPRRALAVSPPVSAATWWEVGKSALAGAMCLAVYFLPTTEDVRMLIHFVPLAAAALLLVPPSRWRAVRVKVAVVASVVSAAMVFVAVRIPQEGFSMGQPMTLGGGPLLLGFALVLGVVGAPLIGAIAAWLHAWRVWRPREPASKSLRRSAASRRS